MDSGQLHLAAELPGLVVLHVSWHPFAIFVFVLRLFAGIRQTHSEHCKLHATTNTIAQILANHATLFFCRLADSQRGMSTSRSPRTRSFFWMARRLLSSCVAFDRNEPWALSILRPELFILSPKLSILITRVSISSPRLSILSLELYYET